MRFKIVFLLCFLAGCGYEPKEKVIEVETRYPPVNPGGGGGSSTFNFAAVQSLMGEKCVKCHSNFSGFTQSEVLNSRICSEVGSKNMPQNDSLSSTQYSNFVDWCDNN
jgi:hypothetical protein